MLRKRYVTNRCAVGAAIAALGKPRQGLITGPPGSVFRAVAKRRASINPTHMQGQVQTGANALAVLLKVISCGLQPVVHMEGVHLPRPLIGTGQQQRG